MNRERSAGSCSGAKGPADLSEAEPLGCAGSFGTDVCAMTYTLQKVAPPIGAAEKDFKDGAVKSLAPRGLVNEKGNLAQVADCQ